MKVIITGATGMVGEGVLLECLQNEKVTDILIVNRKSYGLSHPKLQELLAPDFKQIGNYIEQLKGYDACFYCAGISSNGLTEAAYTQITYDTTLHFAQIVLACNPNLVFNFVSGRSTDASEKGKIMWARVKGKTENALAKMGFKAQYNFRPAAMITTKGQKNTKALYTFIVQVMKVLFPGSVNSLTQIGQAMINVVLKGYPLQTLEVKDIRIVANMNEKII